MDSPPGTAVVVVVPCFNEANRLRRDPFVSILSGVSELEFLFVDDGSTDGTGTILNAFQAERPDRVGVLHLPQNSGKAEAVRQGVLRALGDARLVRFIGYWDADLSTPLHHLHLFIDYLATHADCRVVIGSRVRLLGREISRRPFRHYVGRFFSTLASLALDLPVYDTQCGAKLFRPGEGMRAAFSSPFSDQWIFDVEILLRLRDVWGEDINQRVYELPLPSWHDVEGSKVRFLDGIRATLRLLALWGQRSLRSGGEKRISQAERPGA